MHLTPEALRAPAIRSQLHSMGTRQPRAGKHLTSDREATRQARLETGTFLHFSAPLRGDNPLLTPLYPPIIPPLFQPCKEPAAMEGRRMPRPSHTQTRFARMLFP